MRLRFRGFVPLAAPPAAGEPPRLSVDAQRLSVDPHRLSVDTGALHRLALDERGVSVGGPRRRRRRAPRLARADYRHALDVWQWVLTLDRDAGVAVQLAALFRDVERVISPTDRRQAEAAVDYAAAKRRHAEASARAARDLLAGAPIDAATLRRTADLIAADALSFLVLNSHGYRRFHGDERWRDKVRWTLARLGPRGHARLAALRLAPDLAAACPPSSSRTRPRAARSALTARRSALRVCAAR